MVGAVELVLKFPIFRLFTALSQDLMPDLPAMNLADHPDPASLRVITAAPAAYFSLIPDYRHLKKITESLEKRLNSCR
jgi:hypothetical protein